MKKFLTVIMMCMLTMSLVACGGKKETTTAEVTPPATTAPETPTETASADAQAVLDAYQAMLDRYNSVVDMVNADEELVNLGELTDTISMVSVELDKLTDEINATKTITEADALSLREVIEANTIFIDEIEAMAKNYAGKTVITINATVVNQSGADLYELAISPTNDESWGANLLSEPLKNGETGILTMSLTEDSLIWDIMASDSEGTSLEFMGLDFSGVDIDAGATITLGAPEGDEYTATVQ